MLSERCMLFIIVVVFVKNMEGYGNLQRLVKPLEYHLEFFFGDHLFKKSEKVPQDFKGMVTIILINNSTRPVDTFNLNCNAKQIYKKKTVSLRDMDGNELATPVVSNDPEREFLILYLPTPLKSRRIYNLTIKFKGKVHDVYRSAIYKTVYMNNGTQKFLLATHFMPTFARSAFPCFDEPVFKATFQITAIFPKQYHCVSNTLALDDSPFRGNYKKIVFATTPVMSTYLLTMVISELERKTAPIGDKEILIELYMRSDVSSLGAVSLKITSMVVDLIGYSTRYPFREFNLTKMSVIAIPDTWQSGMEGWGASTFREDHILWDTIDSSARTKQKVAEDIVHKLVHQWFGNLVTCEWFSDLFIMEGMTVFFTFINLSKLDQVEKELEMLQQFVGLHVQRALYTDSMSSHPLYMEVHNLEDVLFLHVGDDITFSKGASIMYMLYNFMTPRYFSMGCADFLRENKFGNANHDMLWRSFNKYALQLPEKQRPPGLVSDIMKKWTTDASYPLIHVTLKGTTITLRQESFNMDPEQKTEWYIPINYILPNQEHVTDAVTMHWMEPGKPLVLKDIIRNKDDWIVLNINQGAYYRVNYDDELLRRIKDAIVPSWKNKYKSAPIPSLNKAQIVDDLLRLATFNKKSYTSVFVILRDILSYENDYYVWYSALEGFKTLLTRTAYRQVRDAISIFLLEFLENLVKKISYEEESSHMTRLKQDMVLNWACLVGHEQCIFTCRGKFDVYIKENIKPHNDIRPVVYCNAVRWSDGIDVDSNWDLLWEEFLNTSLPTEEILILNALGCIQDPDRLRRYLHLAIEKNDDERKIKKQDAIAVFTSVASNNPAGADVVLDFLIDNFQEMHIYFREVHTFRILFTMVTEFTTSHKQIDKLKKFSRKSNMPKFLKKSLVKIVEDAEARNKYTDKMDEELLEFFNISVAAQVSKVSLFVLIFVFIFLNYLM